MTPAICSANCPPIPPGPPYTLKKASSSSNVPGVSPVAMVDGISLPMGSKVYVGVVVVVGSFISSSPDKGSGTVVSSSSLLLIANAAPPAKIGPGRMVVLVPMRSPPGPRGMLVLVVWPVPNSCTSSNVAYLVSLGGGSSFGGGSPNSGPPNVTSSGLSKSERSAPSSFK